MRFEAGTIGLVITSPSAAFARLCKDPDTYLGQSVSVFLASYIAWMLVPILHAYLLGDAGGTSSSPLLYRASAGWGPIIFMNPVATIFPPFFANLSGMGSSMLFIAVVHGAPAIGVTGPFGMGSSMLFIAVVHLVGRMHAGSRNWKETFVVLLHIHVLLMVAAAVIGTMWAAASLAGLDSSATFQQSVALVHVYFVASILFIAWVVILSVRAIKAVHSFGTVRAIGLLSVAVVCGYAVHVAFDVLGFLVAL